MEKDIVLKNQMNLKNMFTLKTKVSKTIIDNRFAFGNQVTVFI